MTIHRLVKNTPMKQTTFEEKKTQFSLDYSLVLLLINIDSVYIYIFLDSSRLNNMVDQCIYVLCINMSCTLIKIYEHIERSYSRLSI